MKNLRSFYRVGWILLVAAALPCVAQTSTSPPQTTPPPITPTSTTSNVPGQSQPPQPDDGQAAKKLPYTVDPQSSKKPQQNPIPADNHKLQSPPAGLPSPSSPSAPDFKGETKGRIPPSIDDNAIKHIPAQPVPPSVGEGAGSPQWKVESPPPPEPDHIKQTYSGEWEPVWALASVGFGGLLGLGLGAALLIHSIPRKLKMRPNGDRVRERSSQAVQDRPHWLPQNMKLEQFQRGSALRNDLISAEELRDLSNRYLVSANFSFSMLAPALLLLVCFTMGAHNLIASVLTFCCAAIISALVTAYALDRRHLFRHEYRSAIIRNFDEGSTPIKPPRPPAEPGFGPGLVVDWLWQRLLERAKQLLDAQLRTGRGRAGAESDEEDKE